MINMIVYWQATYGLHLQKQLLNRQVWSYTNVMVIIHIKPNLSFFVAELRLLQAAYIWQ